MKALLLGLIIILLLAVILMSPIIGIQVGNPEYTEGLRHGFIVTVWIGILALLTK